MPLVRLEGESDTYCTNIDCPQQRVQRIVHFASRSAMDIEGLGEQRVVQLVVRASLVTPRPVRPRPGFLAGLDKMGELSEHNLLTAIAESKERPSAGCSSPSHPPRGPDRRACPRPGVRQPRAPPRRGGRDPGRHRRRGPGHRRERRRVLRQPGQCGGPRAPRRLGVSLVEPGVPPEGSPPRPPRPPDPWRAGRGGHGHPGGLTAARGRGGHRGPGRHVPGLGLEADVRRSSSATPRGRRRSPGREARRAMLSPEDFEPLLATGELGAGTRTRSPG